MSLKKPIAEIRSGLFCFWQLIYFMQNSHQYYYDNKIFDEKSIKDLFPLKASEFIECEFHSIDFTQSNLSLSKFIECKFSNCNLSNVSLKNALLRDCEFIGSKLMGLNFAETQGLSTPKFSECSLDYSVFQSLNLSASLFRNCSLKETDFYEANLFKSDFSGSHLSGAVFNKANLATCDFRGAQEYFIDLRITNVKKAKFNLPEALGLLQALDIILE